MDDTLHCESCGASSRARARFCGHCGLQMPARESVPPPLRSDSPRAKSGAIPWAWIAGVLGAIVLVVVILAFIGLLTSGAFQNASSTTPSTSANDDAATRHAIEEYWTKVNTDYGMIMPTLLASKMSGKSDESAIADAETLVVKMIQDGDALPDGLPDAVKDEVQSSAEALDEAFDSAKQLSSNNTDASTDLIAKISLANQRFEDAVSQVRTAYFQSGGDPSTIPDASQ